MIYPLPPILQTRGLKLLEMGEDEQGAYLKFGASRNRVRSVTVYMKAPQLIQWRYIYSIYDPDTKTVTTYSGPHGDPNRDHPVTMRGA